MIPHWPIPQLFAAATIVILGGGPSLLNILKGRQIRGCPVIGINDAFTLGDWVTMCFFGDARWYWWHEIELRQYHNLKVTCDRRLKDEKTPSLQRKSVDDPDLRVIECANGKGICRQKGKVFFNSSSGGASINLAWHLGAKRIFLLGFDMRRIDGRPNWHERVLPKSNKPYTKFIEPFNFIAKDAKKLGLEIINCTPGSLLTQFSYVNFEDIYASIK
jgi:hypothetical protein